MFTVPPRPPRLNKLFGKHEHDPSKPMEPHFVQIEPEWLTTNPQVTRGERWNELKSRLERLEADVLELQRHIVKESDHD